MAVSTEVQKTKTGEKPSDDYFESEITRNENPEDLKINNAEVNESERKGEEENPEVILSADELDEEEKKRQHEYNAEMRRI